MSHAQIKIQQVSRIGYVINVINNVINQLLTLSIILLMSLIMLMSLILSLSTKLFIINDQLSF